MQGVQHRGSEEYQARASPVRHAALQLAMIQFLLLWINCQSMYILLHVLREYLLRVYLNCSYIP